MPVVNLDDIARVSDAALSAIAVPHPHREIITRSIVDAHATGKGTHGIGRLPIYLRKVKQGLMHAGTPLTEITSGPAFALLDAEHGFGQVAGILGMQRAIEMAKVCGISLVGIRHSHSFGTAAFTAKEAAHAGMVGIVLSNASAAIAPTGGKTALFGTNPMAFAFPGEDGAPAIVLDMATAQVARSKVRQALANGEPIPLGWALDEDGNPTTDAERALNGSMIPVGGAKGYGLSLVIDVLAGLLTGSGFAGGAYGLNHPDQPSNCGHFLVAIDITKFMTPAQYQDNIAHLTAATKAAGEAGAVSLPGARSGTYMEGRNNCVPISDAIADKVRALTTELGIAPLV